MTTPTKRIADAYASKDPHREALERRAAAYKPDPQMEAFISWRTSDPNRFGRIPTQKRLALGHYERAKQAAVEAARKPE